MKTYLHCTPNMNFLTYVRRLYCHYYFILDVTISHIITMKSLIVVIRKPSFFGGGRGLDRCDIIIWGAT